MGKTAIIGFGRAGHAAAESMRASGYTGEIHVFGADDNGPANPMLTTYYASGKIEEKGVFPFGNMENIANTLELKVLKNAMVHRLDADAKQVYWDDQVETYDNIIIATGATPIIPFKTDKPWERVFAVRTLEDAQNMLTTIKEIKKGLVVGASMVGIKVIQAMTEKGIDATLADLGTVVFPTAVLPQTASVLEDRIKSKDVAVKLGISATSIEETENQVKVVFSNGEQEDYDAVFFCIGTRAETGFAKEAGIAVDRGIIVDSRMRTNKKDIYAVGDCAQTYEWSTDSDKNVGLWANAALQGKTAGANIAGQCVEYAGNLICNITHFWNTDFVSIGNNRAEGQLVSYQSPAGWSIEVLTHDGKPQCVNIIDNLKLSGVIKNFMAKKFRVADAQFGSQAKLYLQEFGVPEEIIHGLGGI